MSGLMKFRDGQCASNFIQIYEKFAEYHGNDETVFRGERMSRTREFE